MTFPSTQFAVAAGAVLGSLMAFAGSANAFSFTTNYTLDDALSGKDRWRGDILLDSVIYGGQIFSDFSLVNAVDIIHNDLWTGGNTGAASADRGKFANDGIIQERLTADGAVQALGNLNLSSIIDGEDRGAFTLNLFFDRAAQDILFWERGKNSALDVRAIDQAGNLIGNLFTITQDHWDYAGYDLGTTEIGNNIQRVGSWGISAADLGLGNSVIHGVQVSARGDAFYNGPDFKVIGTAAQPVPEPSLMLGFGSLFLLGLSGRRRSSSI